MAVDKLVDHELVGHEKVGTAGAMAVDKLVGADPGSEINLQCRAMLDRAAIVSGWMP